MKPPADDIVISFDCLPKIGGAHLWLYEVYRRWPGRVSLLATMPALDPVERAIEVEFDRQVHGALSIFRAADAINSIGMTDFGGWLAFLRNARRIRALQGSRHARLHALRAIPEGFSGYVFTRWSRGTQLVTYAHGEDVLIARTSRLMTVMARAVYRASDLVVANSQNTRNLVLELCPSANVIVVHPGVDVNAFAIDERARELARSTWGWGPETLVLATVARMEARKNQSAVLRAIAELRDEGLDVAYVCAGHGPEAAQLRELAAALGIEAYVKFPGRVSDEEKCRIFAAADVHAMPSIDIGEMIEGFGIVFMEAAAAGTPSIAGRSGGQAEAVLDEQTGLLVDGRSAADLKKAIRRLADRETRARMGSRAREWAQQHDWGEVARKTALMVGQALG